MESLQDWVSDGRSDVENPMVVAGMLVVGLLFAVLVGVKVLPWLANKRQGYPAEEHIERVAVPALLCAICAAYRLSEMAVDEFGARMAGADKAAVAKALYGALPEHLRALIPEKDWGPLVEEAFDWFLVFYDQASERLDEAFAEWVATMQEEAPGQGGR